MKYTRLYFNVLTAEIKEGIPVSKGTKNLYKVKTKDEKEEKLDKNQWVEIVNFPNTKDVLIDIRNTQKIVKQHVVSMAQQWQQLRDDLLERLARLEEADK